MIALVTQHVVEFENREKIAGDWQPLYMEEFRNEHYVGNPAPMLKKNPFLLSKTHEVCYLDVEILECPLQFESRSIARPK